MPFNWLYKIRNHEVTPPESAWQNITNELDKEDGDVTDNLKAKMIAHETTPPPSVLNNIFNALEQDDNNVPAYVEKIKNHSEPAPVLAWDNIVAQLDKEEENNKVVPLTAARKKIRAVYLRVAAAAAVIAIAFIAILSTHKKTEIGGDQLANKPENIKVDQAFQPGTVKNIIPATETTKNNPVKTSSSNNTKSTVLQNPADNDHRDYVKGNSVTDLIQDPSFSNKEKLQNSKGKVITDIALMNTPNTYFSIIGADGEPVKVSSKLSNLVGYLSDKKTDTRENIEVIIDENPKWRKIFAAWKDKMINNNLAPSFTNFMDIIELSKVLEEKNN